MCNRQSRITDRLEFDLCQALYYTEVRTVSTPLYTLTLNQAVGVEGGVDLLWVYEFLWQFIQPERNYASGFGDRGNKLGFWIALYVLKVRGRLGSLVGEAATFSSGHDPTQREAYWSPSGCHFPGSCSLSLQ